MKFDALSSRMCCDLPDKASAVGEGFRGFVSMMVGGDLPVRPRPDTRIER